MKVKKYVIFFAVLAMSTLIFSSAHAEEYYSGEYRKMLLELYNCLDRQMSEYELTENSRVTFDLEGIPVASRGYEADGAVSWNDARKITAMLCGEHPRFLSTVNNIGYYYDKNNPSLISHIDLKRLDIEGSYEDTYNAINARADEIIGEIIQENMTDLDKAFAVYMYLITNCASKSTAETTDRIPDTIYGIFLNNEGSCGGFANAFKLLMDKLNIPCEICNSRSKGHLWNYVKIEGKWYHTDAIQGVSLQSAKTFLVSGEERKAQLINSDKIVYDWASINEDVVCDSSRFDDGYLFDRFAGEDLKNISYDNDGYYFEYEGEEFYFPSLLVMNNMISIPRSDISGKRAGVKDMVSAHCSVYGNKRDFTAYIVCFNSDGDIVGIERRNITFSSADRKINLSTSEAENADKIKIFFWTDMIPVANVMEIN